MASESWSHAKLEDLAEGGAGGLTIGPFGSNLLASDYRTSGVPVVFVRDLVTGRFDWKSNVYLAEHKARELHAHGVRPDDVVVTKMGDPPGIAAVYPQALPPGVVTADVIRVRPNRKLIVPAYLAAALNHAAVAKQVRSITAGLTRPKITLRDYRQVMVWVPPLSEQREIAAALKAVDDAIVAGEVVVEQLDRVRRALLEDLLRNGMPRDHHRRADSPAGSLPEGWSVRQLAEVAAVQTGLAKGKVPGGAVVELPYLRVANVQDGYVDLSEVKTVQVEPAALDRYRLRDGDVLFTEGGDFDKLGRGCVWRAEIEPCLHQNHVFAVRTGPELLPDFLAAHAASQRGRAYFLDCAKRTTNLASINSTQLKAFPVPIPPLAEQRAIVDVISTALERIANERAVVAERRRVKTALADALLSGRMRLRDAA